MEEGGEVRMCACAWRVCGMWRAVWTVLWIAGFVVMSVSCAWRVALVAAVVCCGCGRYKF